MILREMTDLDSFNQFLNDCLTEWGFSSELQQDLELVSEEVIVNVLLHSRSPSGPVCLEVECVRVGNRVKLVFCDNGEAYDPLAQESELRADQIGGWGIPILKALISERHYRREGGRNILTLIQGEKDPLPDESNHPIHLVGGHMALKIELIQDEADKLKIELVGRLDTNTTPMLEEKLAELDSEKWPVQVLDLRNLDYVSSAGLRCIFKARRELMAKHGILLLVNLQPQVRKVFEIIKVLKMEEVFSNLQELDAYLDKMQRRQAS